MITLEAGETLLRDYWPAEVAVTRQGERAVVHKLARVYVTDRRTIVALMVNGRVTSTSYMHAEPPPLLHMNGVQGGRSKLTATSSTVMVSGAHGCGCSSPLRSLPLPRVQ